MMMSLSSCSQKQCLVGTAANVNNRILLTDIKHVVLVSVVVSGSSVTQGYDL